MKKVGYSKLLENSYDQSFPGALPVIVDSSLKVVKNDNGTLRIPTAVAPKTDNPIEHIEFALKHQGVSLAAIENICADLEPFVFQEMIQANPEGRYARIMAALFEMFSGQSLEYAGSTAKYCPLFNPKDYLCGPDVNIHKYRVAFNGLGTTKFSPIVRLTDSIKQLLARDFFADLNAFVESLGGERNLDRAIGWAYIDETKSSFEIEKEGSKADRAKAFIRLLHQAHARRLLTEDYFCELQHSIEENPRLHEFAFRHEQNWLQRSSSRFTSSSVTYLPPSATLAGELMGELIGVANRKNWNAVSPLVQAALISFSFVFIHPFMDGNGRISRFLLHQQLCRAEALKNGLILPISVSMKEHEADYLDALQSVSRPIRDLWDVTIIDESRIAADFLARGGAYRFFDATGCVEFSLRMSHHALDYALIKEVEFLKKFDQAKSLIQARYSIRDNDLNTLIRCICDNGGVLSKNRRKQFDLSVDTVVLNAIEREVRQIFQPDLPLPIPPDKQPAP
jgi:hypothetical protein